MSSFEDAQAGKQAMRREMRVRRAAIIASEGVALARKLAEQGLDFLAAPSGAVVSAFASMLDELDTAPLLTRLHRDGYRLCLPVMQGKGQPLLFRAWTPGDDMAEAVWGIREPKPDKPLLEPDIFLVPLLAFDRHGWRLGYGGGFFDRTLRAARAARRISAVGLGLMQVQVDVVPHLDYDERLDWVLTPSGPIRCVD